MENEFQIKKAALIKELVKKMFQEARIVANTQVKEFKKLYPLELEMSTDDEDVVINRSLSLEYPKYKKELNINNIRHAKAVMTDLFNTNKAAITKDLMVDDHSYEGYRGMVVEQLVVSQKIKFLKTQLESNGISNEPSVSEKILWLGTPSQLGYLFNELIDKNFISMESPVGGKRSKRKFAKLLYRSFYVHNQKKDGQTSFDHLNTEFCQPSLTTGGEEFIHLKKRRE